VRVRDLVESDRFEAVVAACPERLDDAIRWVHVTDLLDPSPYLRGGELILSNALWFHGPDSSRAFVRALAASDVHALGVALYGDQSLPAGLAQACTDHDVVLLQFADVAFIDITELVISQVMDERRGGALRLVTLEQELAARLAAGHGPQAVVEILARELAATCWVVTRDGHVISEHAIDLKAVAAAWRTGFDTSRGQSPLGSFVLPDGRPATFAVVASGVVNISTVPLALAVYECDESAIKDQREIALTIPERFLPMSMDREADRPPRFVAEELVARLRHDDLSPEAEERLLRLGGLSTLEAVAVIDAPSDRHYVAVHDALTAAASFHGRNAVIAGDGSTESVAFIGVRDNPSARDTEPNVLDLGLLAESAADAVRRVTQLPVSLGIARAHQSSGSLARTRSEAHQARLVAALDKSGTGWAKSSDIASHLLLLANATEDVREALRRRLVVPLADYDRTHKTDLIHSLSVFLDASCSWQTAAQALHIHVNTLRYRLARVEQLVGCDLAKMSDRVDLYLGLRA
jgi:hypothetical protein